MMLLVSDVMNFNVLSMIAVCYVSLNESSLFFKFKCNSRTNVIASGGECNALK